MKDQVYFINSDQFKCKAHELSQSNIFLFQSQNQFGDYRVFRDLNDTEIPASWTFGSKDKKGRGNENGQGMMSWQIFSEYKFCDLHEKSRFLFFLD